MGKSYRIILCLLLPIFVFTIQAEAQFTPTPVEKSKQKILFQGKVYYVHTVKKGQTLYSISRAYGVTEQDIANANPNILLEVIKPRQVLKIPESSSLSDLSESYYGLTEKDFIFHSVEPQQTLFYLSRRYNIPEEIIIKYNPGCDEVMQIGQIIKIPKKHLLSEPVIDQVYKEDTTSTYFVKHGDTLYSLAKKYGVSVADFIEINPELRWGLKDGMTLRVPGYFPFDVLSDVNLSDSGMAPKISLFDDLQCDSLKLANNENHIKIVLMLPFHTNEILALDTISNDSIRKSHPYNLYKKRGRSLLSYYEGLLLAVDSIKSTGKNVTLFTYDTRKDTNEVKNILKEVDYIKPNLIIGPLIPNNIKLVAQFSEQNKIPLILPLSRYNKRTNTGNPYSVYLLPDVETELNVYANFISGFHKENLILIHEPDSISMLYVAAFKNAIFGQLAAKSVYESTQYKEFKINDSLETNINHAMRNDMKNIFIIVTNDEADVISLLTKISLSSEELDVQVLGRPTWQTFTNLQLDLLHKLNTIVYSPFYIDYSKTETVRFVTNARNILNAEPYKTVSNGSGFNMSYLGYETGMVFLKAYLTYGKEFVHCLCSLEDIQPQTTYTFKYLRSNGFSNNSLNFINYTIDYDRIPLPFSSSTDMGTKIKNH